jgi:uncharacterized protein YcbX
MTLAGIFLYPVKSLRGFAVDSAELDGLGLVGDRRFLVVDDQGQFLTQRALPAMARIATASERGNLILRNPAHGSAAVALAESGPECTVQVWRDTVTAEDCGVEVAVWLSDFLRHPCRLVRIGKNFSRPVTKPAAQPGDAYTFADGAPLLGVSEASLANLNDRILERGGEPVPMDRFRPNLVFTGGTAFAEDEGNGFKIGGVTLRSAGRSERCIMTTTDQKTGERGKEPLRTLATFRRHPDDPGRVYFGQNLINASKSGTIRVGDTVTPLA